MANPGPIKRITQTIKSNAQSRKEEKQRAADQGYKYNRNVIHDAGEGKSRNIKGSVAASAQRSAREVKQDVKLKVDKAKQRVKTEVNKVKETMESRKAMKTATERGMRNRVDSGGGESNVTKRRSDIIELNKSGKGFNAGKQPNQKPKSSVKGKNVIQKAKNKLAYSRGVKRSKGSGIS